MAAPAAPKNARWERLGPQDLVLKWDKVAGATSYGIRWIKGSQTGWDRSQQGWHGITTNSFTAKRWSLNSGYRFVVYATNKDGNSLYSNTTAWFYTPPPVPKNLRSKVVTDGVQLSWSRAGSYYTSGTQLEGRNGGLDVDGPVVDLGNGTTSGASATTFFALGDGGENLQYRARGFVGAATPEGARVYGPWTDWTKPLWRQTKPLPPEIFSQPFFVDGGNVKLEFSPMPTDQTGTSQFRVRLRPVGTEKWLVDENFYMEDEPNKLSVQLPLNGVGRWEWQACTASSYGLWSDWSAIAVFELITRPTLTVDTPPVNTSRPLVSWVYSQAQNAPQSAAIVQLVQAGTVLQTVSVNGNAKSVRFKTVLKDKTAYSVKVKAAAGAAWTSTVTKTWTTDFVKPAAPLLQVTWDEQTGVHLVKVGPGSGGAAPTLRIDVYADIGSGWVLFAEGLPPSETVLPHDWGLTGTTPTLYRAVAYAAHDAAAETVVSIAAESDSVWVKSAEGHFAVRYDVGFDYTPEKPNRVLVHFDGETKPVVFDDDAVTRRLSVTGQAVVADSAGDGDLQELRANIDKVLTESTFVMVCAPDGFVIEGIIVSATVGTETGGVGTVTFEVEETM